MSIGEKAANVGKKAAVAASVGAAAYVGGGLTVGTKTRGAMERGMDGIGDDLTHVLTHAMSDNPLEESIALRGHGACAATRYPNRPLPFIAGNNSEPEVEGPDF